MELSHCLVCTRGRAYKFLVSDSEFLHLSLRVGVGFRDTDTGYTAFDSGVDSCVTLSSVVEGRLHCPAVMHRNDDQYRHTGEDYKGKVKIDRNKIREGKDDHNRADKQILRAVMRKLADLEKIACDPRHYLTRLVVIVELVRKSFKMPEQIKAHFRLHSYAYQVSVVLHEITKQHTHNVKRKDYKSRYNYGSVHLIRNVLV